MTLFSARLFAIHDSTVSLWFPSCSTPFLFSIFVSCHFSACALLGLSFIVFCFCYVCTVRHLAFILSVLGATCSCLSLLFPAVWSCFVLFQIILVVYCLRSIHCIFFRFILSMLVPYFSFSRPFLLTMYCNFLASLLPLAFCFQIYLFATSALFYFSLWCPLWCVSLTFWVSQFCLPCGIALFWSCPSVAVSALFICLILFRTLDWNDLHDVLTFHEFHRAYSVYLDLLILAAVHAFPSFVFTSLCYGFIPICFLGL